jgi:hypothetical protein
MREQEIRENGVLVAINPHHKSGHFYEYKGKIYRAMLSDFNVYPIASRFEIDKSIAKGSLIAPTGNEHFCEQCNKPMGHEWLLGPVCGVCCRWNHKKVTRH